MCSEEMEKCSLKENESEHEKMTDSPKESERGTKKSRSGQRKRDLNADLIRCAAVYSVISVHFLLNSRFYYFPTVGTDMYIMSLMRACFMVCVPLFMILTGYLMWQKKLTRGYYKGIWKTIEIYVLASIACLLFKKYAQGQEVTLKSALFAILDFSGANYAWYIEMYIGLFLIIPFLNGAYHSLDGTGETKAADCEPEGSRQQYVGRNSKGNGADDRETLETSGKKKKQILILTMIFLTMLPKLLNNFDLVTEGWWASPSLSTTYTKLIPSFFTGMYPITYYFIGAYLREYGCRLSRWKNLLLFALAVLAFGTYNFYRSDGQNFVWGSNSTWGGENLITASLLFIFLLHLHPDRWPRLIQKALIQISRVSLGLYLLSWIFDKIIYAEFLTRIPDIADRWKYYPVVVPTVFLCAFAVSFLIYLLRDAVHKAAGYIKNRLA